VLCEQCFYLVYRKAPVLQRCDNAEELLASLAYRRAFPDQAVKLGWNFLRSS
jgi:hypothetical protein